MVVLVGNTEGGAVTKGSKVSVEYTGTFDDGTVFDSTEGKQPIEFVAGEGQVIKGFDDAVVGMKKGEQKKVTITPQEGYGNRDEKLKHEVPRSVFPPEMKLEKGMGFSFKTPKGEIIHAAIADSTVEALIIDMNHPLAGRNLVFEIKVVDVA